MINNLAATNYDKIRTATDVKIPTTLKETTTSSGKYVVNASIPYWTKSWFYTTDNRHGYLYNFVAATNSAGASPSFSSPKVQGICPNGWHLPTDDEFTALENAFIKTGTTFSSITVNPNYTLKTERGERGDRYNINGHGNAMKEGCMNSTSNEALIGLSHTINTTDRPGFEVLLSGQVSISGIYEAPGEMGTIHTSSTPTSTTASGGLVRVWATTYSAVVRDAYQGTYMFSVRCKKDN